MRNFIPVALVGLALLTLEVAFFAALALIRYL